MPQWPLYRAWAVNILEDSVWYPLLKNDVQLFFFSFFYYCVNLLTPNFFETTFSLYMPVAHHIWSLTPKLNPSGLLDLINKQTCDFNYAYSLTSMQ